MQKRPRITTANSFRITAKTVLGLEDLLAEEIRAAGGTEVEVIHRGVSFKGSNETLYRSNYTCRTALRFLKPLYEFTVRDDKDLYRKCLKLPWDAFMDLDTTFAIDGAVFNSSITHWPIVSRKPRRA